MVDWIPDKGWGVCGDDDLPWPRGGGDCLRGTVEGIVEDSSEADDDGLCWPGLLPPGSSADIMTKTFYKPGLN